MIIKKTMPKLYYTPPADEQFNELKRAAIELWNRYDDEYGYASKKVDRIKDIQNVGDNFMYIVAMFDIHNHRKLADMLSPETRTAIRERMIDGGECRDFIIF